MGYYMIIRPLDSKTITVQEFKQRLLDYGLEVHPSATDPREDPVYREKFTDTLVCIAGTVDVYFCDQFYFGTVASVRLSWSENYESMSFLLLKLIGVARAVNAELLGLREDIVVDESNLHRIVEDHCKGRRIMHGSFGVIGDREKNSPTTGDGPAIDLQRGEHT